MARKYRKPAKPLFAGLSIDLPTGPEIYAENFKRQQAELSASSALLKTPPTPPNRRVMPGDRPAHLPIPADIRLLTTRGKNGVRESVGTPSVPMRTRKTAGVTLKPGTADGKRRSRSLVGFPVRDKRAEKVVYSGRVGMSARKALTVVEKCVSAEAHAARQHATLQADGAATLARIAEMRTALQTAIGRERDALAQGDQETANTARAEIRALRKSIKGA